MGVVVDDYTTPFRTADNKFILQAVKLNIAIDDYVIPVRTADGKFTLFKVSTDIASDDYTFPVRTADGKFILVKFVEVVVLLPGTFFFRGFKNNVKTLDDYKRMMTDRNYNLVPLGDPQNIVDSAAEVGDMTTTSNAGINVTGSFHGGAVAPYNAYTGQLESNNWIYLYQLGDGHDSNFRYLLWMTDDFADKSNIGLSTTSTATHTNTNTRYPCLDVGRFDGTQDVVATPNLSIGNAINITNVFRVDDLSQEQLLWSWEEDSDNYIEMYINTSGTIKLRSVVGGVEKLPSVGSTPSNVVAGEWMWFSSDINKAGGIRLLFAMTLRSYKTGSQTNGSSTFLAASDWFDVTNDLRIGKNPHSSRSFIGVQTNFSLSDLNRSPQTWPSPNYPYTKLTDNDVVCWPINKIWSMKIKQQSFERIGADNINDLYEIDANDFNGNLEIEAYSITEKVANPSTLTRADFATISKVAVSGNPIMKSVWDNAGTETILKGGADQQVNSEDLVAFSNALPDGTKCYGIALHLKMNESFTIQKFTFDLIINPQSLDFDAISYLKDTDV